MSKKKITSNFLNLRSGFYRLKSHFSKDGSSFKNRLAIFLIFVVLSSILWYYRALDDTFIASLNYPVRYQNLPKNKILVGSPPKKIELKVRGLGYDIVSNKLKFKTPLNFNINSFLLYSQANDSMSVYILTRYAREALTEELNKKNTNLEIVSILPDTIFFNFTRTKAKKVVVKPSIADSENIFARQYTQNGPISCSPDSITIIGPATIVDSINSIYTKELHPSELIDSFRKRIDVIRFRDIEYSNSKVEVTIPTDKFTEIGYEIPILTKYVPDSINMKLFPRKVRIYFNITHSNIPLADEVDFIPYIDYRQLNGKNAPVRLNINLDSLPEYAKAVRFSPTSVEYINEINDAQDWNNRGDR